VLGKSSDVSEELVTIFKVEENQTKNQHEAGSVLLIFFKAVLFAFVPTS
jgi:hypothetical protein